jgi:hypothetical protein
MNDQQSPKSTLLDAFREIVYKLHKRERKALKAEIELLLREFGSTENVLIDGRRRRWDRQTVYFTTRSTGEVREMLLSVAAATVGLSVDDLRTELCEKKGCASYTVDEEILTVTRIDPPEDA